MNGIVLANDYEIVKTHHLERNEVRKGNKPGLALD
jgi:hypothetical protein